MRGGERILILASVLAVLLACFVPSAAPQPCRNTETIRGVLFEAPNLDFCPGGTPPRPFINVSNACNREATVYPPSSEPGPRGCGERGVRWRWDVRVDGGPITTLCQDIVPNDTEKPVLTLRPRFNRTEAECGISPLPNVLPNIEVTDNCPPPPNARQVGDPVEQRFRNCREGPSGDAKRAGRVIRTFSARDRCGNEADPITHLTLLVDTTPPRVASRPPTVKVPCRDLNNLPPTTPPTFNDACWPSNALEITKTDYPDPTRCRAIRTWKATDPCGNSVTVDQTLELDDTTPPTATPTQQFFCLWPPNRKHFCVSLNPPDNPDLRRLVRITDDCSGVKNVRVKSCSVKHCSNPPCPRADPCVFNNNRLCLEVERDPRNQQGRTYRVQLEATDNCGNTRTFELVFVVPFSNPNSLPVQCWPGNTDLP